MKIMIIVTRNETMIRTITLAAEDKEAGKQLLVKADLMLDRYISNTVIGITLAEIDPVVMSVITHPTTDDRHHAADLYKLNLPQRVVDILLFNNIVSTIQLREMSEIQLACISSISKVDVRVIKRALMEQQMSFMNVYYTVYQ